MSLLEQIEKHTAKLESLESQVRAAFNSEFVAEERLKEAKKQLEQSEQALFDADNHYKFSSYTRIKVEREMYDVKETLKYLLELNKMKGEV